jgi:hypothetical protein
MSPILVSNTSSNPHLASPIQNNGTPYENTYMRPPEPRREAQIDPALTSGDLEKPSRMQEQGYKDAIRAWSRFRFVRAGWFTPMEAIDYMD